MNKTWLLTLILALTSVSHASTEGTSVQGRILQLEVAHSENAYAKVNLTVKDVCPIFPAFSFRTVKLTRDNALLEFVIVDRPCQLPLEDQQFVVGVNVREELLRLGLDPEKARLLIDLK
jgi:hypothetical protein